MCISLSRRATALTALLLALFTFVVALLNANSGHEWGDDFAAYLSEGIAIANGTLDEQARLNLIMHPSEMSFLPDSTDSLVYAWGFPLMLVPIYLLFGYDTQTFSSILYYKLPGILCLAVLAAVLFLFYRRRFSWLLSVFLTVLLVFSADIFTSSATITTDLPFLCFSMLSLLLLEIFLDSFGLSSWRRILLALGLGASLWAAYVIRLNGITIVLTCLLASALSMWSRRKTGSLSSLLLDLLPYFFFGLCLLISYQFLPVPTSNVDALSQSSFGQFSAQVEVYLNHLSDWINHLFSWADGGTFTCRGLDLLFLATGLCGLVRDGLRRDLPLFLLAAATFLGTCMLNYDQGIRYLYICLPLLLVFVGYGIVRIFRFARFRLKGVCRRGLILVAHALPAFIIALSLMTCLNQSIDHFKARGKEKPLSDAFSTEAVEMYCYLRENTSEDAVIAFFKPRLLSLNTGRLCFKLQVDPSRSFAPEHFLPYQPRRQDIRFADYILLYWDDTGYQLDIVQEELGDAADELVLVHSNSIFALYQRVR